jgi:uncharacterized membrane protein YwzB
MGGLVNLIIIIAVLICAWWVIQRFSPDPLITKIAQVIIFVVAVVVVLRMVLPLAGINLG